MELGIIIFILSLVMWLINPRIKPNFIGYRSFFASPYDRTELWKYSNRICGILLFIGSSVYIILLLLIHNELLFLEEKFIFAIFVCYLIISCITVEISIVVKKRSWDVTK